MPTMYIITPEKYICIEVRRSEGSEGVTGGLDGHIGQPTDVFDFSSPQIGIDSHFSFRFVIYNTYLIYCFFLGKKIKLECIDRSKSKKCESTRACENRWLA